MIANDCIHVQGRRLSARELVELQVLIDEHPQWSRHGVAKELCQRWDWRTPAGGLKTFAARSLLRQVSAKAGTAVAAGARGHAPLSVGIGPAGTEAGHARRFPRCWKPV